MLENSDNTKQLDKDYSISELYFIIRKNIKIISIVFSIVFCLCLYYTLITNMFINNGVIIVSDDQKSMSMLDFNFGVNRNHIQNEIQILKSRTTMELTVNQLLTSKYRNDLYILGTKKYEPTFYRKYLTLGY